MHRSILLNSLWDKETSTDPEQDRFQGMKRRQLDEPVIFPEQSDCVCVCVYISACSFQHSSCSLILVLILSFFSPYIVIFVCVYASSLAHRQTLTLKFLRNGVHVSPCVCFLQAYNTSLFCLFESTFKLFDAHCEGAKRKSLPFLHFILSPCLLRTGQEVNAGVRESGDIQHQIDKKVVHKT